ncbi:Pentatricopeptide repeat-containing protein [Thalictrum thalictroides]|uniref:Pentatricopeptide repeat-containing protein n=1 Tax=Thalictrum thalictroides TaxID=46969 RepID=A0A7J6UYX1_THATH|nr:Pentatricopeptide repeat-containing protein [Thalictrum thalictroides]
MSAAKSLYRIFRNPPSTPRTNPTPPKPHNLLIKSLYNEQNLTKLVENFKKCSEIPSFRRQHKIYRITVVRLASAERFSSIEEIFQHQKKYDSITREGFAVRLIYLYGKVGMFDHAFKLFDELPQLNCQRTLWSFNALLSACVWSKQFNKAEELFREMPLKLSISPDVVTYNIVIQALCEMGSFDSAESMLSEMESNGVKPNVFTFNTIMHKFYDNGQFCVGERIWDMMEKSGIAPNIVTYNSKMQGLLSAGKLAEVFELVEELHTRKLKPSLNTYNILIRAYCSNGNLDEAKKMYDCLLKDGFLLSRSPFRMLIRCCCENGDLDLALKLCEENMSVISDIGSDILQLVVDGLVKRSRVEEAERLVNATSNIYDLKLKMPSVDE